MAGSRPEPPTLRKHSKPPMGLKNLKKSSCYLNSVLQCLTFTPPLADYCKSRTHYLHCTQRENEDCTFCILEQQILSSLSLAAKFDAPRKLYEHVTTKSGLFVPGRQEDAHEFLNFMIHECGNRFQRTQPNSLKELSLPILFGGKMKSRIECGECKARSITEEEIMDLGLIIFQHSFLIDAFDSFFRPEVLDGENKYRCGSCNILSVARKRLSILQMPPVLIIQMKRFDPLSGQKLDHHVRFEKRLCLAKYLSEKFTDGPVPHYILYGLIVHWGESQLHGHYVACIKETNGKWYLCDDDDVSEVSEELVLTAIAYLLFYIRSDVHPSCTANQTDESVVDQRCTSK